MSRKFHIFYALDREFRFTTASPNAFARWGRTPKEVIGRKLFEVFPDVEGGSVHDGLIRALQTYRPVRLKTDSILFGCPVNVEIYPMREGLQVSFSPTEEAAAAR